MVWYEINEGRNLVLEHPVDQGVAKPASSLDVGDVTCGMVLGHA